MRTRSHASIEKEEGGDPEVRVLKVLQGNYVKPAKYSGSDGSTLPGQGPDDLPPDVAANAPPKAITCHCREMKRSAVPRRSDRAGSPLRMEGANLCGRACLRRGCPRRKGFDDETSPVPMGAIAPLAVIRAKRWYRQVCQSHCTPRAKAGRQGAQVNCTKYCTKSSAQSSASRICTKPLDEVHNEDARSTPPLTGEIGGKLWSPLYSLGVRGANAKLGSG